MTINELLIHVKIATGECRIRALDMEGAPLTTGDISFDDWAVIVNLVTQTLREAVKPEWWGDRLLARQNFVFLRSDGG